MQEKEDGAGEWRTNRERGWHGDIGYVLQDVVQGHRYDYKDKGIKPDDPGWHVCSCGEWEGYWSGFEPHVADHLREAALAKMVTLIERERDHPGRGWNDHTHPEKSWSNGLMRGIREGMTAAASTIKKGF